MRDILYMAWKYLYYHKLKTLILVFSITLIIYLPIGLRVVVNQSADSLTARAKSTPLILGSKGSPLELVLNSLYFESKVPDNIEYGEFLRLSEYNAGTVIPLNTRFKAGQFSIVGTSLDYFDFRKLQIEQGHNLTLLGECVLGAKVAQELNLLSGDNIMSSPEGVFNLAGVYPLKMKVAGILEMNNSPDDEAVFVDIKTAWVIEGLAHGHQDLSKPEAAAAVLKIEGNNVVGNAAVKQYNEITPENMNSFHFHGNTETFPLTAFIVKPYDEKAATLLRGKYLGDAEKVQIVQPTVVMTELLNTILTIQAYVIAAIVLVALSTILTSFLVFMLSLRLRKREINTMHKIGGAETSIMGILAAEIIGVLLLGSILALILTLLTAYFGSEIINGLLMN